MSTNDEIRKAALAAYEQWQDDWNACYALNAAATRNGNPPPGGYPHVVDRLLTALAPYLAPHPAQQGEDGKRLDALLTGKQNVSRQAGWDGTQGEVRITRDMYASEDGAFQGHKILTTRAEIDMALHQLDAARSHSKQEGGA